MIIFDTNILVYAQNQSDVRYGECRKWVKKVEEGECEGVVSSQNLVQFVTVVNNLSKMKRVAMKHGVEKYCENYRKIFKIVFPNSETMVTFEKMYKKYKGNRIFDLFLVATMISNGVDKILTYNVRDFKDIEEIKVIDPESGKIVK